MKKIFIHIKKDFSKRIQTQAQKKKRKIMYIYKKGDLLTQCWEDLI